MFEDLPILSINVKIWKFCSVILVHNWKRYAFVIPVCIMNILQVFYLYEEWGNLRVFILHSFFAVAIFNALLRTFLVIKKRAKFESFMMELEVLHNEVQEFQSKHMTNLIEQATRGARMISIFNLSASFLVLIAALLYPIFSSNKVHPFGVSFPGIDMTRFPIYEIIYFWELSTPFVLTFMYMPFVSLFASFARFGVAILKILQYRLENAFISDKTEPEIFAELISCIKYHDRIIRYVAEFNSLVTYICLIEFLLFGARLCALLFCLNLIQSWIHIIAICMYILTMLYVLFIYYWQANELAIESLKVAESAYNSEWFNSSTRIKRALLLVIIRSQAPLQIMVGNIYPMTLETFQKLLNASYSYFTVLRGFIQLK